MRNEMLIEMNLTKKPNQNYKRIKVAVKGNNFGTYYSNKHSDGYSVWYVKLERDTNRVVSYNLLKINQNKNEIHRNLLKNYEWLKANEII
jgi:hypothetical protein